MGRPAKLNISQQQQVVKLYLIEKLSTNKIAKQFDVSAETISATIRRNGLQLRSGPETNRLSTNFSFVKMTEEKSFLLGLIYGDGSISIRQDYINITSGDLDLLEKSKNILGNKFKIEKVKEQNCHRGVIYSHKLCEELYDLFQLTNNKSDKLVWPNLEPKLFPFFISGYAATDGCIRISSQDNLLTLNFYSCSKEYLKRLNIHLCEQVNIPLRTLYERKNIKGHFGKKPLYVLAFNGIKAEKACEYIFHDTTPETRSDRKFAVYHNFISDKYN